MPLTDVEIRNAKLREVPYRLADSLGLYILVHPNGGKYWRLKYRYAGQQKTLAIGVYPRIGITEARRQRNHARELLDEGRDPSGEKKAAKRVKTYQAANSFEAVAREWLGVKASSWTADHVERVTRSLEQNIFTAIGCRPIGQITTAELHAELRRIQSRGALEIAARVLQRSSAVFRYAIVTDRIKTNPAADLKGALKTVKVKHRAALSAGELPEFLSKLATYDGHPFTKLGLRLVLLTFVRVGELRGAEWQELDLHRAEWRIPAERMKMSRPHIVPLARQTMEIIHDLKPLSGQGRLLFPGQSRIDKPMSENTLLYALYRMGYHSRATVHGFRATACTILNEEGEFRPDVIERQLAHIEQNKVRAAYHRSEYLDERRRMMQWWADYLDRLKQGAEVIPIGDAA